MYSDAGEFDNSVGTLSGVFNFPFCGSFGSGGSKAVKLACFESNSDVDSFEFFGLLAQFIFKQTSGSEGFG